MSEPLTNLEIQDVLSSIRRLISEDKRDPGRPNTSHTSPGGTEGLEKQPDDKLILTSAQRIDSAERKIPAPSGSGGAALEDTIAELEAAVAGIGGDFEPDGSEVVREYSDAADAELEKAFEDGFEVDIGAEAGASGPTARMSSPPVAADDEGQTAPQVQDEPEAVDSDEPANQTEEAQTQDSERSAAGSDPKPENPAILAEAANASTEAAELDYDLSDSNPLPSDTTRSTAVGTTGRRIRRRLNLTAQDMVTDAAPWDRADATAREPDAEGTTHAGPAAASSGESAYTDDLEMEILRELVTEIVRQEFKGPMGERMTRNIRMLVRREVNRALESHKVR
ncbi:hypothetical protein QKW60_16750 [Defluviimonas aestuarii]|uniref:hypothetical protein n=1 Tax=Albidovulum aestuarii TaxID=1130726 RepID=UPI002499EC4C|nr:hypothetical protein [Defluviimonas aestuarii]MDI3338060.1 hypothetical protein [Defluviimonas aestuarii]